MSDGVCRARGTLEMDLEARAPAGVLTASDGCQLEFSDWTELAAVIEDWRAKETLLRSGPAAAESGG